MTKREESSLVARRSGFSLVELMLAIVISGIVLGSVIAGINLLGRTSVAVGNYSDMSGSCRRALDIFASDVRMADDVSVSTSTTFTFTAFDAANSLVTVSYVFDDDANTITRTYDGTSTVLLRDVQQFGLAYYDLTRGKTTNALSVKEVQIEAILQKEVLTLTNTDEIISARFMLRNRRVSS